MLIVGVFHFKGEFTIKDRAFMRNKYYWHYSRIVTFRYFNYTLKSIFTIL